MIRVLCLDGGGAKGVIPLTVLKAIQESIGKPIYEEFDLIIGSSVGAIIGGILSTGLIDAKEFHNRMLEALPVIFKPRLRIPILDPKYKKENVQKVMNSVIAPSITMKEACRTKFVCTSINMVDGRTHYFKSWEPKDGELPLCEVIDRSYAAPLYFGTIKDKENQSIWMDGGCGGENSPIMEAFIEICRQGWVNERVHILSIGCGSSRFEVPYNEAKGYKNIRQIGYYMNPVNGGLSRLQSSLLQTTWMTSITKDLSNITFQRVTKLGMDKMLDKMDAIEFIRSYVKIGEELSELIDYKYLKN